MAGPTPGGIGGHTSGGLPSAIVRAAVDPSRRRVRIHRITAAVTAGLLTALPLPTAAATRPAIAWHSCVTGPGDEAGAALDEAGAACGEVTVPVDHGRPGDRTITVALARIRATDPDRRRGVLMLNPGGPGDSGVEMVLAGTRMPAR